MKYIVRYAGKDKLPSDQKLEEITDASSFEEAVMKIYYKLEHKEYPADVNGLPVKENGIEYYCRKGCLLYKKGCLYAKYAEWEDVPISVSQTINGGVTSYSKPFSRSELLKFENGKFLLENGQPFKSNTILSYRYAMNNPNKVIIDKMFFQMEAEKQNTLTAKKNVYLILKCPHI
nr:hypothetical protein [uncultured Prevotella sp.]